MAAKESQADVSNEKCEDFRDAPPPYSETVAYTMQPVNSTEGIATISRLIYTSRL